MSLSARLYSHLLTAVGTTLGNRIYLNPAPPNSTMPLLVYRRVYGAHTSRSTKIGASSGITAQWQSRWQIDVLSKTYSVVEDVTNTITAYFSGLSDYTGTPIIYDCSVDMSFNVWEGVSDAYRGVTNIFIYSSSS